MSNHHHVPSIEGRSMDTDEGGIGAWGGFENVGDEVEVRDTFG